MEELRRWAQLTRTVFASYTARAPSVQPHSLEQQLQNVKGKLTDHHINDRHLSPAPVQISYVV